MKRITCRSIWALVLASLISACSGGGGGGEGGGGGTSPGITYTGVATQAFVTKDNANKICAILWDAGPTSNSISPSPSVSKTTSARSENSDLALLGKRIGDRFLNSIAAPSAKSKHFFLGASVNETTPGSVSGTKTETGSLDDNTGQGSLTITYSNYNDGEGYTYDGAVTMRIDAFDMANMIPTDLTLSFSRWTIQEANYDLTLSGSLRLQVNLSNNSMIATANMDGRDNIGNETFRFENFVSNATVDNIFFTTSESDAYSGRVFVDTYGYVDISTLSPFTYAPQQDYPSSGGPVVLAGAGNSKARMKSLTTTYARIEVDADGDNLFEANNVYLWSNMEGMPIDGPLLIADAGGDQTVNIGSVVVLDGSGSVDSQGGVLTYAWTMTASPPGSNTWLSSPTSTITTFTANVPGTYTVSLVVSNGTATSSPVTVVITATYVYSPLTAYAGPSQDVSAGSVVTLDGSGSWDMNGGFLTYAWTMLSTPPGSSAVLSNPSSITTTFTPDVAGQYIIRLVVSSGTVNSNPSTVIVNVRPPLNSGLLKPYVTFPTGSHAEAVAIGDVNGDGKNDVVVATSSYFDPANDYHVFVFYQNSAGGLDAPVKYAVKGTPQSVAIGDINHDGKAEVVIGNTQNIEIFSHDSGGGLVSSAVYTAVNSCKIKIADLNHDERLDVVGIGWGTNTADVFLQNGQGTFDPPVTYSVTHGGYDDLEVGDVNNDGLTDIIVMSGQSLIPNIGVLTQKPDGTFNPAVYYSVGMNQLTSGAGVGDVNGDSLQDIIVSYGGNGGRIGVFYQNNSGALNANISFPSYDSPQPVEIGDINNDGRKDIVVAHSGWMNLGVYLQAADGTLLPEELYPIPYGPYYPHSLAIGDINGDGLNDVALTDANNGLVVLYHK